MTTFTNAKVVSRDTPTATYLDHGAPRGAVNYQMTRGELIEFLRCPARWLAGFEPVGGEATEWGTLVDCLLLTPAQFKDLFAVQPTEYPDSKTGEMKPWAGQAKFCKAWKEDQGGRIILRQGPKEEDGERSLYQKPNLEDAKAAVQRILGDPAVAPLLEHCERQVLVAGEYVDGETGMVVPVKGLIDVVPHGKGVDDWLADLKTARDASAAGWSRTCFQRAYHVQAAWFLDLWNAATNEERTTFAHIVQENVSPWQVGRRILSQEFLTMGRALYREALRFYARCLKEAAWPDWDWPGTGRMVINGWTVTQPEPWMVEKELASCPVIPRAPREQPPGRDDDVIP